MGLGTPGFLPCFVICAWVLPVVGLLQLVVAVVVLCTKNSRGALHLLSALAVFIMTFGFYQYLKAGNFVTVQDHQVSRSLAAELAEYLAGVFTLSGARTRAGKCFHAVGLKVAWLCGEVSASFLPPTQITCSWVRRYNRPNPTAGVA